MYRDFFGLNQLPFKISPDLNFFYKHASREDLANALLYSLARGDGILKLVGEVGSGKTTLLRLLASKLPDFYQQIYISAPNLSAADFLKLICSELSITVTGAASKHDVLKQLHDFLLAEHDANRKVVLLIDEAQSMTIDTLEEVRLLGNLETETDKLLQVVLCGQPELDLTLEDDRIRPLKSRIATEVYIPELDTQEVMRYLNYRMRVAGNIEENVFSLAVSKKIQKLTKGLPRQINLVADKLLMSAFSDGDHFIQPKHFESLGIDFYPAKPKFLKWLPIAVILTLFLISGLFIANYLSNEAVFGQTMKLPEAAINEISSQEQKPNSDIQTVEEKETQKTEQTPVSTSLEQPALQLEKKVEALEEVNVKEVLKTSDFELYEMAFSLMEQNKFEESLVVFKRVLDDFPTSEFADNAAYWIGEIYMVLNQQSAALQYFKKVVDQYPESSKAPAALLRYGDVLANFGKHQEAIAKYKLLINKFPTKTEASVAKRRLKTES